MVGGRYPRKVRGEENGQQVIDVRRWEGGGRETEEEDAVRWPVSKVPRARKSRLGTLVVIVVEGLVVRTWKDGEENGRATFGCIHSVLWPIRQAYGVGHD